MSLVATCHCGSLRVEVPHLSDDVKECNCTYCHRTGAVWAYYREGELAVTKSEHDSTYSASGPMNEHHFCSKCGGNIYGSSPDWASMYNNDGTLKAGMTDGIPTQRIYHINLRMVDDVDLKTINILQIDGRNSW